MPDSTHFSLAIDAPTLEITVAKPDVDSLSEKQMAEIKRLHIERISAMSPKEFLKNCDIWDVQPTFATGWMIANLSQISGSYVLHKDAHLGWKMTEKAVKYRNEYSYDVDPMDPTAPIGKSLNREIDFWLSFEEASSGTPIFLVKAGEDGPLLNIGTWLNNAESYDLQGLTSPNLGRVSEDILSSLKQAGNPSIATLPEAVKDNGLDIDLDKVKTWLEAHRPEMIDQWSFGGAPAP